MSSAQASNSKGINQETGALSNNCGDESNIEMAAKRKCNQNARLLYICLK